MEFHIKSKQMAQRLANLSVEEIADDPHLYLAQYASEIAIELGIQIPIVPLDEEDGPCHPYTWRQDGEKLPDNVLQRATWKLLHLLWNAPDHTASFADLAQPVFGDHALNIKSDQVGKQRTLANNVFKKYCIPWIVKTSATDRLVSLKESVADRLKIPFYALDLNEEFARIIDYFADEYTAGRTPNPCVQCNNWIKFGKLFDYADSVGAEFVATGHYARLQSDAAGEPALLRGRDAGKDQSYVLFGIGRRLLRRMLLPVGDFEKTEIRRRAAALGLNVAEKKDSQEICFVTSGRYDQFIRSHRAGTLAAGELVTTDGTVVGQHNGIEGFTVGQRKGLGVALGEPKFVVRIEPETRRVVLGDRSELANDRLSAAGTNWLVDPDSVPRHCQVQIRYNSAAGATVELLPEDRMGIVFDEPQFGITPGQAVVCYDGARTLGGGWIE